jgi:exopolysaccharide biosynthesis protein
MKDGTIKFADVSKPVVGVKDGIGFSPSLIVDGVAKSWNKNISKSYIIGYEPRHAFMETENYYVEVFVNGRQPLKGWFGCSIPQLTELCKAIGRKLDGMHGGCKQAGNLDGGGSSSLALEGFEVIKNTNYMRPVDNGLGIKMKK